MLVRIFSTLMAVCMISLVVFASLLHADEPKPATADSKIKQLQKERLAILKDVARLAKERIRVGQGTVEELRDAERMLLDAELELCSTDKERVEVLERHLSQAQEIEQMMDKMAKAGIVRTSSSLLAKADRLQVEIALARAKEKMDLRK
ncbi:MAG TPA: hypothetical protein VKS79_05320 [Gemmataceae bacterium]|nr:hypothetical protein [Gemmataceae bacterium]